MQALAHHGPGRKKLEDRAKPDIQGPGDAIVRITRRFKLAGVLQAYETFDKAAQTQALKVIIQV